MITAMIKKELFWHSMRYNIGEHHLWVSTGAFKKSIFNCGCSKNRIMLKSYVENSHTTYGNMVTA
jgi:hypothetical protein